MAHLRDMSTTAEIGAVIQMCFFDMLPQICSVLKSDPITLEIHPYLQNCISNILELHEFCVKNYIKNAICVQIQMNEICSKLL